MYSRHSTFLLEKRFLNLVIWDTGTNVLQDVPTKIGIEKIFEYVIKSKEQTQNFVYKDITKSVQAMAIMAPCISSNKDVCQVFTLDFVTPSRAQTGSYESSHFSCSYDLSHPLLYTRNVIMMIKMQLYMSMVKISTMTMAKILILPGKMVNLKYDYTIGQRVSISTST